MVHIEQDSDREALLADFGQTINVTDSIGSSANIVAIFDNEYTEVDIGEAGVQSTQPKLLCRTTDVSNLTEGDLCVIDSTNYFIQIRQDDGTGMTELFLRVAS